MLYFKGSGFLSIGTSTHENNNAAKLRGGSRKILFQSRITNIIDFWGLAMSLEKSLTQTGEILMREDVQKPYQNSPKLPYDSQEFL